MYISGKRLYKIKYNIVEYHIAYKKHALMFRVESVFLKHKVQ